MVSTYQSSGTDEEPVAGLPCLNSSASFWHSEPSKFLLYHQTTPDLPQTADFVIVGSGITGASVARFVAEDERAKGTSVLMLEAREACWGATGRNGGHCQPLLIDRGSDVAAFEKRNVETVKAYISKHNIPCEWRDVTACRTYWDKERMDRTAADVKHLKESNPELGALVSIVSDKKELPKHRVKSHAAGATLTQGAASLWPYKYVTFILEKLIREERLNLQTNTPVTRIEPGATTTLHTTRGRVKAKHVILATNGYSSHLLPEFRSLIVPVRCEMSALHPPGNSERLEHSYGFVSAKGQSEEFDDYLIQRPFCEQPGRANTLQGGHLMFGGGQANASYSCIGVSDDDIVDEGEAGYLRRTLLELLELGGDKIASVGEDGIKELKASHQWTGIKGYSKDSMPWVGKVPERDGIWLCGGYTGHGMPNATLSAKAVVDMVLSTAYSEENYSSACHRLVKSGGLPESYVITPDRIAKASELPTIAKQIEECTSVGSASSGRRNCEVM